MIEWRPVEDFHGYEVSNTGLVRGRRGEIKLRSDTKGYLFAPLWRDGKPHKIAVARLVAQAFIGPRPVGQVVRHRDGVKSHNFPGNLVYGTQSQNELDKREHGTAPVGTNHPAAKLSEGQVREIRARFKPYCRDNGGSALGRVYGVSPSAVLRIASGRLWSHIA